MEIRIQGTANACLVDLTIEIPDPLITRLLPTVEMTEPQSNWIDELGTQFNALLHKNFEGIKDGEDA